VKPSSVSAILWVAGRIALSYHGFGVIA
jgi:hypothetical protein